MLATVWVPFSRLAPASSSFEIASGYCNHPGRRARVGHRVRPTRAVRRALPWRGEQPNDEGGERYVRLDPYERRRAEDTSGEDVLDDDLRRMQGIHGET